AVEEPKPKPAKIRAVSYEAAIDQLFKGMRSSSSALTQQGSVIPDGRYATKDVAGDRHMADARERQVTGHQRLAGRRQLPHKTDPDAGRLLGVVFEAVVPVGVVELDREHEVPGERLPDARRTTLCPGVWPPVRRTTTPGATSYSNGRSWLWYSFKNRLAVPRSTSGIGGGMEAREKSGDSQNSASAAARWTRRSRRSRSLTPSTSSPPTRSMCMWASTTSVTDARSMPAASSSGPPARPAASPGTPPLAQRR